MYDAISPILEPEFAQWLTTETLRLALERLAKL